MSKFSTVRVVTGAAPYAVNLSDDLGNQWLADEPLDLGGANSATSPDRMLLGSLGACTAITLQMYSARKKWPLTSVVVELQLNPTGKSVLGNDITRKISLHGALDDAQRERLLQIANACPVHKILTGEVRIISELIAPAVQPDISETTLILERIEAHSAEIGTGFTVRRALPTRARRMVGAWCFLDHVGPADYAPGNGLNVGPHPHIGLQTFTWMIEGEILHRDSLGYEQIIRPGQVNLMTAGNGIVHSEESVNAEAGRLHTTQLWIALPESQRSRPPDFKHYPDLPMLERGGFSITVLAGSAFGMQSPAQVYTPLIGMDFKAQAAAQANIDLNPQFEHAALCLRGAVNVAGEIIEPGTLLYLGMHRESINISCSDAAQLLIVGGEPFPENILMFWNFVARTPEEIFHATEQWNNRTHFGEVENSPLLRLVAPDPSNLRIKS